MPQTTTAGALRAMVPTPRQLGWPLTVNGLAPLLAYVAVRPHVRTDAEALTVVLAFPILDAVVARWRGGHTDPVAVITIAAISLTLAGTVLVHRSALLLKVRPSAITALFGLGCLASLVLARPALFYLGRAFATHGDAAADFRFDELFGYPAVARTLRQLTAVWGVALLAQAAANIGFAITTSTEAFLVASLLVDWIGLAMLLVFTTITMRRTADRMATGGPSG